MMKEKRAITDGKEGADPTDSQKDVAGLYSWAQLEGSKYRDFSESRQASRTRSQQTRESKAASASLDAEATQVEQAARSHAIGVNKKTLPVRMGPRELPPPRGKRSASRVVPRWAALKGVLDREEQLAPKEMPPTVTLDVPCLALVSFAGGVGKTSLVASLSHALADEGQKVLVVDTQSYGLLPIFFGTREVGLGNLRTFSCGPNAAPIVVMTTDPEEKTDAESLRESKLAEQIAHHAKGMQCVLIDVASGATAILRQVLRLSPTVLFVLSPDTASMVSLQALQDFLQSLEEETAQTLPIYYLLNRFDESISLHDYVRDALSEQLGDRLLPFVLHHSDAVSEALAEGMTVGEYAPRSEIARDLKRLSQWVRDLDDFATKGLPDIRWSER